MKIALPIVLLIIPIIAFWLTRHIKSSHEIKLPELQQWRVEEKRTLWVFGLTALAWITRKEPFGGWGDLLSIQFAGDSTIALFAVIVMFIVPNGKGGRLLDWKTANSIPWGMLLLFAGGIALAKGFVASGLSDLLGNWLASFSNFPLLIMVITICLVVTYLTEITSNTATATLLMPILASTAMATGHDPLVFMIPAVMSASCAFMLPVATAPNAIAFGTGEITIAQMVKEGAALSFIVACVIGIGCCLLLGTAF